MRQLHSGLNLSKIDGISGGASAAPNGDDMDKVVYAYGTGKGNSSANFRFSYSVCF